MGAHAGRELLVLLPITNAPAPVSLLELTTCKCKPASKTASVATQDLLAQKFASAWQTMKHVVTPMV